MLICGFNVMLTIAFCFYEKNDCSFNRPTKLHLPRSVKVYDLKLRV